VVYWNSRDYAIVVNMIKAIVNGKKSSRICGTVARGREQNVAQLRKSIVKKSLKIKTASLLLFSSIAAM